MTVLDRISASRRDASAAGIDVVSRAMWVAAAFACLAWAPFVGDPASPDEGGFLQVASQWASGSSLYGDYWVDRPPLLICIHAVAVAAGGTVPLRLIGIGGVVCSILITARLVRLAGGPLGAGERTVGLIAPIAIAGIFLSTPLFGTTEVDGELLSVPFVLGGVVALVRAVGAADVRIAGRWALVAGALAACAPLVKQNAIDVFVVASVVVISGVRTSRRRAARLALRMAAGALATVALVVGFAASRGTRPTGLWDAVVVFRFQAASIINQYATSANTDRLTQLLEAALASAAPFVVMVTLLRLRSPRAHPQTSLGGSTPDLRWPAVALLLWEVASISGGGSYWLHYLLVLVPGMILLAVAASQHQPAWGRTTAVVLACALASAAIATVGAIRTPPDYVTDGDVSAYLESHVQPGDGVVVAFGHPNILWDAGVDSPYPQLWSLPVRVRDPDLATLVSILESSQAPRWVVVNGTSLFTWGVDATTADQVLRSRYRPVTDIGDYVVWRRD